MTTLDPLQLPTRPGEVTAVVKRGLERRIAALERGVAVGPGGIDDGNIAGVSVSKLTGTLNTGHAARVTVGVLEGTLTAGDNAAVDVGALEGTLNTGHAARVTVGVLTGTLDASSAARVDVGAMQGTLLATHALDVNVGALVGTLDASHAARVNVTTLTGTLNAADNADVNVGALVGTLTTGDAARITVATLTGTLTSADPARVAASALTVANLRAITAELGDLTIADAGGRIRTGPAGTNRVEIGRGIATSEGTFDGIVSVLASGAVTGLWDAATGNISLKGELRTGSTGLGNLDGKVANTSSALFVTNPSGGGVTLVADSIATRELAASAVATENLAAGAVTAAKMLVTTGAPNKLRNSNLNQGLAGNPASLYTTWLGPFDAAGYVVYPGPKAGETPSNPDWPSGGGIYMGTNASAAGHVYTPWVTVTPGQLYSGSWSVYGQGTFRLNILYYNGTWNGSAWVPNAFIGQGYMDESWNGGWHRLRMDGTRQQTGGAQTAPSGAMFARMYVQNLAVGSWYCAGPQIEESDVASRWGRNPEEVGPGEVGSTTIQGGALDTHTITLQSGGMVRTGSSGARAEFTSSGITKYDANNAQTVRLAVNDGLELLAGEAFGPPRDRKLTWARTVGGVAVGEVSSYADSTVDRVDVKVHNSAGTEKASLSAYHFTLDGASQVNVQAGTYNETLINSAGQSSFLRLNTIARRTMATGRTNITGTTSGTISHGLGQVPTLVVATLETSAAGARVWAISNYQSSTFSYDIASNAATTFINWAAYV